MGQLQYNDLMLMIEEYSEFKADIAAARAFVEAKQTQIADVRAQIDRYDDIAIYAGVVSDLYVKLRELEAELKQYQEILVQLLGLFVITESKVILRISCCFINKDIITDFS